VTVAPSLLRQAGEAWEVPRDLILRRYPPFVTGGALPRGNVPVFVFHSLEPASFERKLRYLAENGYQTLSAEEYFRVLVRAGPAPDRAVALTFDDGRGSLWSVGYPLLRRYGMRGIVFLVPGRTPSRPGLLPPTWDDVQHGRVAADEVLGREQAGGAFLSWEEIGVLSRSDVYDFQSHTLRHARVHVYPQVVGFLTPDMRRGYAAMDVPLIDGEGGDLLAPDVPLGTPLLRSEPRTAEVLRFHEQAALREACADAVREGGGPAFFERAGWERTLRRLARRQGVTGRFERVPDRVRALRRELAEAREAIEARTGRPVVHLCWPWHAAGATARRIAAEVGYRTAFAGKVPGTPLTLPGGDTQAIARIGEDYLELLPGRGRTSLVEVLRRKWSRRLRGRA
jgi:peptidoglycan/xylan/chitin deacetylase (PgdA/CDA1 family)